MCAVCLGLKHLLLLWMHYNNFCPSTWILSICLSPHLPVCCPSVRIIIWLSLHLPVCLSSYILSICPLICLSSHLQSSKVKGFAMDRSLSQKSHLAFSFPPKWNLFCNLSLLVSKFGCMLSSSVGFPVEGVLACHSLEMATAGALPSCLPPAAELSDAPPWLLEEEEVGK